MPYKKVKTKIERTAALRNAEAKKKVRKSRKKPKAEGAVAKLPPEVQARVIPPGVSGNPKGAPPGKRLLTRIREILCERSVQTDAQGNRKENPRFDDAAEAFVRQLEAGVFQFHKEFIEREEGSVPQVVVTEDMKKLYENVPTEGEQAP